MQQSLVYFMLAVTFAITSSLLIEAHFEIGGDRTVAMISQINEAMAEYAEYHEFTTDDGSDNSNEESNEGDLGDEVARGNISSNGVGEGGFGEGGEVRLPVFPFWTKYHLLFSAVRILKFSQGHNNYSKRMRHFSCWASCAVLNASYIC